MKGATADPDNTGIGYNSIITDLVDHSVSEGDKCSNIRILLSSNLKIPFNTSQLSDSFRYFFFKL